MSVKFEIPGQAFLDGGGVTLCLSEPLGRTSTGNLAGAVEVVFAVSDIDAAYRALCDQGVAFSHAPHQVPASEWAATCEDPDGHKLSLFVLKAS